MVTEVIIPSLGETGDEVKVVTWFKSEGERVVKGEPLLTVESAKLTTEVEAPASGILAKVFYPEGSVLRVAEVVAVIVPEGEELPEIYSKSSTDILLSKSRPTEIEEPSMLETEKGRIRVAPLARKMAMDKGVDLLVVKPTGPHGTIMKRDVERYLASIKNKEENIQVGRILEKVAGRKFQRTELAIPGQTVQLSPMRKTIARRMVESAFSVPHIHLFNELWLDPIIDIREAMKRSIKENGEFSVSINDFLIKGVALGLKEYPFLNAKWEGENIRLCEEINIGLAVALDEGLIVPSIANADRLSLEDIARQRIDLVEKAKQGKLERIELERGTFTITSLAKFGLSYFTAIINPPQTGILSIGGVQERVVMYAHNISVRKIVVAGLSLDHRVVDGAYGAAFLDSVKRLIENPITSFVHL